MHYTSSKDKIFRKKSTRTIVVVFLIFLCASIISNFWPWEFLTDLSNLWTFISKDIIPIKINLSLVWASLKITINLAVSSTFFSFIISFVLAILSSNILNISKLLSKTIRFSATLGRSIPEIVLAYILFATIGIGITSAFLALTIITTSFLLRMLVTVIDGIEPEQFYAIDAVGGTAYDKVIHVIIPMLIDNIILWVIYNIEVNIRSSTIVGIVGGGGIGILLFYYVKSFQYNYAAGVILCIAVIIILLELIRKIFLKILGMTATQYFSSISRIKIIMIVYAIFAIYSLYTLNIQWRSFGLLASLPLLIFEMLQFDLTKANVILFDLTKTFAITLLSTFYGAVFGVIGGCVLSHNYKKNKLGYYVIESIMAFIRAIPNMIWVLITLICFGFGSKAAIVGICIHSTCFLTKAFSQIYNDVPFDVIDASYSCGATDYQIYTNIIMPYANSQIIQWTLYRLEMNFSTSSILGIVGAGGVGQHIFIAMNTYKYGEAGFAIFCIIIVALFLEYLDNILNLKMGLSSAYIKKMKRCIRGELFARIYC